MSDEIPFALALVTGTLLIAGAILVTVITRRAADGRLGRNHLAGIRLPATMRSDEAWVAGHRAAVPFTDIAATGAVAGSLAAIVIRDERAFMVGVLGGAGWLTVWLLVGSRCAVLAGRQAHSAGHDAG